MLTAWSIPLGSHLVLLVTGSVSRGTNSLALPVYRVTTVSYLDQLFHIPLFTTYIYAILQDPPV